MVRLQVAQAYIVARKAAVKCPVSIYKESGSRHAFAVRFLNTTHPDAIHLQELAQQIRSDAAVKSGQRLSELSRLRVEQEVQRHACEIFDACELCDLSRRCYSTCIDVFEYPLPCTQHAQDNVVFEVQIPPVYAHWRDASTYMTETALNCSYATIETPGEEYQYPLYDFVQLKGYFQLSLRASKQRTVLLSSKRPFSNTRFRSKNIDLVCDENDILLDLAADLRCFDCKRIQFVSRLNTNVDLASSTLAQESGLRFEKPFAELDPFQTPDKAPNEAKVLRTICTESITISQYLVTSGFVVLAACTTSIYSLNWHNLRSISTTICRGFSFTKPYFTSVDKTTITQHMMNTSQGNV
jgi:hypothetical protein